MEGHADTCMTSAVVRSLPQTPSARSWAKVGRRPSLHHCSTRSASALSRPISRTRDISMLEVVWAASRRAVRAVREDLGDRDGAPLLIRQLARLDHRDVPDVVFGAGLGRRAVQDRIAQAVEQ